MNGRLLGYKLKYTVTHVADQAVVGAPITKTIDLDKYTFIYKITGLQSYTRYEVSVAGYTAAGDGPYSSPIVSGKLTSVLYSDFSLLRIRTFPIHIRYLFFNRSMDNSRNDTMVFIAL